MENMKISCRPYTTTMDMGVKYSFDTFTIKSPVEQAVDFGKAAAEEVMNVDSPVQRRKAKKQFTKTVKGFLSTYGAILVMCPKLAFASTTAEVAAHVTMDGLTQYTIMQYGLTLAGLVLAAGVGLALIMFGVSAMFAMFGQKEKAKAWSQNTVRGLIQIFITVPVVTLLFLLAQILFVHLPKIAF